MEVPKAVLLAASCDGSAVPLKVVLLDLQEYEFDLVVNKPPQNADDSDDAMQE